MEPTERAALGASCLNRIFALTGSLSVARLYKIPAVLVEEFRFGAVDALNSIRKELPAPESVKRR